MSKLFASISATRALPRGRRTLSHPMPRRLLFSNPRSAMCVSFDKPLEITAIADGATKKLKKGEVRVKIAAAAINFADVLQVKGKYQEKIDPPFVAGAECSGEIIETDPSSKLKVGDKVICFGSGGAFSSHMIAHDRSCVVISPAGLCMDTTRLQDAAALLVSYGTAHLALTARGQIKRGDVVLITAAAGGVGLACCELAKNMGGYVIAAAGSDSKLAMASSMGALPVGVNYTGSDGKLFRQRLKEALAANPETANAKGVDLFVDNVGGEYLEAGMRSMSWNGRAVVVGFAGGKIPSVPANILLLKNISLSGLFWGAHMQFQYDLFQKSCNDLVAMWAAGDINPHISHRVPLADINEALRLVSTRESTGKVIVTMME